MMRMGAVGLACAVVMDACAASVARLDFAGVFTAPVQRNIPGTDFAGVTISLGGTNAGALGLWNSTCRHKCTGGDLDLATGTGITASPIDADEDTPTENYILINSEGANTTFGDRVCKPHFAFAFDITRAIEEFMLIDIGEARTAVSFLFTFGDGS